MWRAKWRIKLNPEKTKVIIFSRSKLARKTELNLKLYGETLKVYPQVNFLGITFDSQFNFKKHFEDILDCCNTKYHHLRLLGNKKWGPSSTTLIQIYIQCVRPIFEYSSLSAITASDYIISKIQQLQNKFIQLALHLPKYICPTLLHDSTGLPYMKDRLLSCATKSLDRITQNPQSRSQYRSVGSILLGIVSTISCISCKSLRLRESAEVTPQNNCHCLKQVVKPICLAQSSDSELKSQQRLPRCPKHLPVTRPQGAYPITSLT